MPDIRGSFTAEYYGGHVGNGAFLPGTFGTGGKDNFSGGGWFSFRASYYNDIYSENIETNQPKAIRGVWIVKYT